jgi:hypothetical protein
MACSSVTQTGRPFEPWQCLVGAAWTVTYPDRFGWFLPIHLGQACGCLGVLPIAFLWCGCTLVWRRRALPHCDITQRHASAFKHVSQDRFSVGGQRLSYIVLGSFKRHVNLAITHGNADFQRVVPVVPHRQIGSLRTLRSPIRDLPAQFIHDVRHLIGRLSCHHRGVGRGSRSSRLFAGLDEIGVMWCAVSTWASAFNLERHGLSPRGIAFDAGQLSFCLCSHRQVNGCARRHAQIGCRGSAEVVLHWDGSACFASGVARCAGWQLVAQGTGTAFRRGGLFNPSGQRLCCLSLHCGRWQCSFGCRPAAQRARFKGRCSQNGRRYAGRWLQCGCRQCRSQGWTCERV